MPKNTKSKMCSREDAEKLFRASESRDPFPDIPPALLNSADIHDYIETTGMVYPYVSNFMKSSSYEAQIGSKAFFWDYRGIKQTVDLDDETELILEPNSLVFIETKQEFRLPPYMAIRFNLRITLVHRGLLLGTGPLVDPGFCGKLLIPIHNLTNNIYKFKKDEKFIWVEFTKISPNKDWDKNTKRAKEQTGIYKEFPKDKRDRTPTTYFDKANDGNPIKNAVPVALESANKLSKEAMVRTKLISWGVGITLVAFVIGIFPLMYNSWTLSTDVSKMISEFQSTYRGHLEKEKDLSLNYKVFRKDVAENMDKNHSSINARLQSIEVKAAAMSKMGEIQKQLDALQKELVSLKDRAEVPKSILGKDK